MSGRRSLMALFAASSPSRDPRRIKIIAEVFEMLESPSEGPDPIAGQESRCGTAFKFSVFVKAR